MPRFSTRLEAAFNANQSLVCIGLDVDPAQMPIADVYRFNQEIIDATADQVCAYKPNLAFYEALGIPGLEALEQTLRHIREVAPQVITIGDAKRGDIGPSGEAYARAMFQVWDFDAVTVNAWGGQDTIEPFLADESRGVFIWCRGSNPGSGDLQDLKINSPFGKLPLYQHLARTSSSWDHQENLCLVMGATYPEQLGEVRQLFPHTPLLIPGIGSQGGELAAAVLQGTDQRGRQAIISSSRGVIYASKGPDFAPAARREATRLRESINQVLEEAGKGWP
ncbi:MAG: orotidine-5'-phosphate decarboxylase [Dehalococcoidia bacterium]